MEWRNPIPHPFTEAALKVKLLRTAPRVLTPRERAVFWSVAHGLSNKEISELMDLSQRTVETYRDRMHDKISGCNGAASIGVLAYQILTLGHEPI
jgi:DNA-binding NarL/FixJ family response regulator